MPADSSNDELFDVVDENDQPIEVKTRREVHSLGLRHRAVHLFLFNSSNQMLIHLRSDDKEEFPSVWTSSASGHVSAGEDYNVAAQREVLEELGVSVSLSLVLKVAACPQTCNEFTQLYSAVSDDPIQFDPSEIQQIRWVEMDDLKTEIERTPFSFSPAFLLLLKAYLKQTQNG